MPSVKDVLKRKTGVIVGDDVRAVSTGRTINSYIMRIRCIQLFVLC